MKGTKIRRCFDSIATLAQGNATELPSNRPYYSAFPEGKSQVDFLQCSLGIGVANGVYDISATSLNDMFPHIPAKGMDEFLRRCWIGKISDEAECSAASR